MQRDAQQIVQRLWSYCNILRDDGLSYPDYVEQLTYLLFLKMAFEQAESTPEHSAIVPHEYDWSSLVVKEGLALREHYTSILENLADQKGMLGIIFHKAENKIRDPAKLRLLVVDLIDKKNWSALDADVKGEAYEGLLEKNAQDTKSGAGQYFTPRPIVQAVVDCVRPQPGELICDPAAGTCGFLLAAHDYILRNHPNLTPSQRKHLRFKAIRGFELVDAVSRLAAMNLLLHGIGPLEDEENDIPIITRDSLAVDEGERYDVVLTNPPFGKRSSLNVTNDRGERERQAIVSTRGDFQVTTSNKQLNFLQHVMTILKKNGRAAVVVPDNVLFEGGAGESIRKRLLQEFDVHTLLRLPTGLFYAQGIKANVLFFDHTAELNKSATKILWVYDLRTRMRFSLRTNSIERSDLDNFVACFKPSDRNSRLSTWSHQSPNERWRGFSYDEIMQRDNTNIDLLWLKDENIHDASELIDPGEIASSIMKDLQSVMAEISLIVTDLGNK